MTLRVDLSKLTDRQKELLREFGELERENSKLKSIVADLTLDKEILFERHLISQELAQQDDSCGVFVTADECLSIMVNEEDHIRIQSLQPGLNLRGAWEAADQIDDDLESKLINPFRATVA